jgi:2-dehydropantoate 2-reductase
MRILFLGAGAVGGYFGGRLAAAGRDVTFLVRPGRAEELAPGLRILSRLGDATVPVQTLQAGEEADPFDIIVIACKSYGLDGALDAIAPHVRAGTVLLPLLNGIDHIERIAARFPEAVTWGGIAHIGATLHQDGSVNHFNTLHRMTVGLRPGQEATEALARAFTEAGQAAGYDAVFAEDITQALWDKWVMLASLAAGTCLMRASVGRILETTYGGAVLTAIIDEVAAIAEAEGQLPAEKVLARTRATLSERGSAWTASMLRDMQAGYPTEADHIIGALLRRASAHGVEAPHLAAALTHLEVYEAGRDPMG